MHVCIAGTDFIMGLLLSLYHNLTLNRQGNNKGMAQIISCSSDVNTPPLCIFLVAHCLIPLFFIFSFSHYCIAYLDFNVWLACC